MATLQPGERARMYALGKIARGGATRGGYVSARAFIAIDGVHVGFGGTPGAGHVGTIIESLSITDALNDTPNTCQFRVNGMVPATGAEVKITLGSKNATGALFAGFALSVQQGYAADKPANINADVSAVDYTWLLGFPKVTKAYRGQSASSIAADLVATYAAANGFTSHNVAPGLPTLTEITYTNEELDQALSRLAQRIGGYWYVDYQKDVHVFIDETLNGAPEVLTPQHKSLADVRKTADRTQVLTRVYVEGRGTSILGAVRAGDTLIPVEAIDMFEPAADVFAKVSPHGSAGAAEWVSFSGTIPGGAGSLVGPGVGPPGAPTVARAAATGLSVGRYQYAYTDYTASGETLPSPLATIDVGAPIPAPAAPPTVTPLPATVGIDDGVHSYLYTYVTAAGAETLAGPASPGYSTVGPFPTTGGIGEAAPGPNGNLGQYYFRYMVTYVDAAGRETTPADLSVSLKPGFSSGQGDPPWPGGCINIWVGKTQTGPTPATRWPIGTIKVRIYRSYGTATPVASAVYFLGEQVTSAFPNGFKWLDVGGTLDPNRQPPITNAALAPYKNMNVTTVASGDPDVVAVNFYRSRVDIPGTPYKLVQHVPTGAEANGAITWGDGYADSTLGGTPPATNTSGNGYRAVLITNLAPGPSPTLYRRIYRTAVNGSQLKFLEGLVDNVTTAFSDTYPDTALQFNAPTVDTSGLTQVPGQVPAGAAAIVVANPLMFEVGGGWAVIGNGEQVIRYYGKAANTLTGIPSVGIGAIVAAIPYNSTITAAPMLTGIPASGALSILEDLNAGDEVNLVVKREDAARQTTLAAMIKTGPGWREEWIQDRRLAIPEARARGDATLALRPLEDVTITYTCRDLRTASGKSITVNLPAPTNLSGTYKIQSVTIANFRPFPTQYPTFSVTASSALFSFEDWLRQMQTKV